MRVLASARGGDMDKLYLSVEEAAEYVGIGVKLMYQYVNSKEPPPYMRVGREKRLQKAALADYFEQRQEVKMRRK